MEAFTHEYVRCGRQLSDLRLDQVDQEVEEELAKLRPQSRNEMAYAVLNTPSGQLL